MNAAEGWIGSSLLRLDMAIKVLSGRHQTSSKRGTVIMTKTSYRRQGRFTSAGL
jgi:hypothetical protein